MTSYTCTTGRTRLLPLPRRTTRKILALPAPSFDRPRRRPFGQIRQRLAEAEGLNAADHRFLLERCDALEDRLDGVEYVLPPGAIHKDATIGNLLPSPPSGDLRLRFHNDGSANNRSNRRRCNSDSSARQKYGG